MLKNMLSLVGFFFFQFKKVLSQWLKEVAKISVLYQHLCTKPCFAHMWGGGGVIQLFSYFMGTGFTCSHNSELLFLDNKKIMLEKGVVLFLISLFYLPVLFYHHKQNEWSLIFMLLNNYITTFYLISQKCCVYPILSSI